MPSKNIDLELAARLAANRTSRRRFIGGGAAAAAALALGPSFLAACSSDGGGSGETSAQSGGPASGTLRISNWPLYMADGFVAAFQTASGITVDYKEDFNDNEQWFAKNKEPLSRKQDIGADLAVPTTFMAVRLHQLGWLNDISDAG
ncbi:MAG: twin-arginine translocation signal domain-containing protein, partial [Mycobacterium sp.]